jgi:acetylornithine deacetylase
VPLDESLRADAVSLAAELVHVDSANPGLVPGAAGEAAAVALLEARLAAAGFATRVVVPEGHPDRPSLLAHLPGSGGGRSLALNGHLDTVGTGGMADPFAGRVVDGRLLGRGACDMKGGVAAMVVAAEAAAREGLRGDLWLALVADEENASLGTEAVIAALESAGSLPDACLVGEPTWLDLVVAHRGFALVEVALRGHAAHSSRPGDGVNAVAHLGRLLTLVEAYDGALRTGAGHPVAGYGSLMSTVVYGGSAPFTLAAAATALVERRTVPGEDDDLVLAEVRALVASLHDGDPDVDADVTLVMSRPPWAFDPAAEPARLLAAALADGLVAAGRPAPRDVGAPYWMESALWDAAGVPTVVCGPAGGGLHATDEWGDVAEIGAYADALAEALRAYGGDPE